MTETRRRSGKLRRRAPNIPRSGRQIPSTPRENGISVTIHRLGPSGAFDQDPAVEIIRKSPPISLRFSFPHHPCDDTATSGAGEPGRCPGASATPVPASRWSACTERACSTVQPRVLCTAAPAHCHSCVVPSLAPWSSPCPGASPSPSGNLPVVLATVLDF